MLSKGLRHANTRSKLKAAFLCPHAALGSEMKASVRPGLDTQVRR